MELGFTIPFITIPIRQKYEDGKKPLVDINVGAITAGTILTTAALIFIPKAFSGLEPQISFGKSKYTISYQWQTQFSRKPFKSIVEVQDHKFIFTTICNINLTIPGNTVTSFYYRGLLLLVQYVNKSLYYRAS